MGLDFNTSSPQLIRTSLQSVEACAAVSDPATGELLFYTQGSLCWNRNHQRMPNGIIPLSLGTHLDTSNSGTTAQGAVIVPMPGNPNRHYIFSLEPQAGYYRPAYIPRATRGGLYYSIADMTLDGGLGDLVPGQKGILLDTGYSEAMIAVMGACSDYWLIVHLVDTPVFHASHITAAGVDPVPVISSTGSQIRGLGSYAFTYIDVSPDGQLLALTSINPNKDATYVIPPISPDCDGVLLCRFDPVSGRVSDGKLLHAEPAYGACFSPDNSKLYVDHPWQEAHTGAGPNPNPAIRHIYQYEIDPCYKPDIVAHTGRHLLHTDTIDSRLDGWSQFKRFRGKIYITNNKNVYNYSMQSWFDCIHAPDLAGAAAQFGYACQLSSLRVDSSYNNMALIGLPPNVLPRVDAGGQSDTVYTSRRVVFCQDSGLLDIPCNIGWQARWLDGVDSLKRVVTPPARAYVLTYYAPGCKFHMDTIEVIFSGGIPPVTGAASACRNGGGGTAWIMPPLSDTERYAYIWIKDGDTVHTGTGSAGKGDTLFDASEGVYRVYYTTEHGCSAFTDLTVPLLYEAAFEADTVVCAGDSVQIENRSAGNFTSWRWDFGDGQSDTAFHPLPHVYPHAGLYQVRLITSYENRCHDTVLHTVTADSFPYLRITADRDHICAGEAVTFYSLYRSGTDSLVWQWTDERVVQSGNGAAYIFNAPGVYPVTVTAFYTPCPDTSVSDTIHVALVPLVNIGPDTAICPGDAPIRLANLEEGKEDDRYRWSTGDATAAISVQEPGVYWLQVISDHECTATDSITVHRSCYLDVPNAFTPDGDGSNDYFFPREVIARGITRFHMQIFNRWGQLVYETKQTSGRGWDGTMNGKPVSHGVFVYLIEAAFENGRQEQHQGNVTLLR